MKKINIGTKTFIALGLGIAVGFLLLLLGGEEVRWIAMILSVCKLVGNIFLRLLQMLAVPLVFASVTNAIVGLGDMGNLRRLGLKTFAYFFVTGCIAVTCGITICNILSPGTAINSEQFKGVEYAGSSITLVDAVIDIVPKNIVNAMATDSMMQVIVFCVLLGIAILLLGEKAKPAADLIACLEQIMFRVVDFIMIIIPYGVFSLMVTTIISCGTQVFGGLLKFILCDWITCLLVIFILDTGMLIILGKVNPLRFLFQFREAIMIAMATCVSVTTIPFATKTLIEKIGVPSEVTKFVLPLGATANMTGTAGFFGIIVVFTAQLTGVQLTMAQYVVLVFQAVMMAMGCATVPSIALVLSSTLLMGFGLPVTSIGMIIGVYRLMDIAHTTTNSIGNWVTSTCIASLDHTLDRDICGNISLTKSK